MVLQRWVGTVTAKQKRMEGVGWLAHGTRHPDPDEQGFTIIYRDDFQSPRRISVLP